MKEVIKKIILLPFLLLVLLPLHANAQQKKEQEKSKREQKLEDERKAAEGTLQAAWEPVMMDHIIGIRGGYGLGMERFEPARESANNTGLLNFGLMYRFNAPTQKYVGCIEFNLNFMQKGYKYETYKDSGMFYTFDYSIVELPILWQPYIPLSKKNPYNRIYLSAGPYLGYVIGNGKYKLVDEKNGDAVKEEGDYNFISARDNRFEYGIAAGLGVQVAIKRFVLGVEFRYNIMLSNLTKSKEVYPSTNTMRSPVDQMNLSFVMGFKLNRQKESNVHDNHVH